MIDVVIVDDHPAILAGISAWYAAADPPIRVVATGADADVAWAGPGRAAGIVVLDLHLHGEAGAEFGDLQRLVEDGRQVIVYSMREDNATILTALDLGACAYVTKSEGEAHLVAATHAAAAARPYTPPTLAGAMATDSRTAAPRLAPRESEVLLEWFRCESKDMVARKLNLSTRTVAGYIDRVRIKYANAGRPAATKAALVARAIQDDLIRPEDL